MCAATACCFCTSNKLSQSFRHDMIAFPLPRCFQLNETTYPERRRFRNDARRKRRNRSRSSRRRPHQHNLDGQWPGIRRCRVARQIESKIGRRMSFSPCWRSGDRSARQNLFLGGCEWKSTRVFGRPRGEIKFRPHSNESHRAGIARSNRKNPRCGDRTDAPRHSQAHSRASQSDGSPRPCRQRTWNHADTQAHGKSSRFLGHHSP
jgi:hypothetical protein